MVPRARETGSFLCCGICSEGSIFVALNLDLHLACFFFFFLFPPPKRILFSKIAIFEETHAFLDNERVFGDLVHKGVKQQDSVQTIRPHNRCNSPHKAAISRKRAQFQEAYFFAVIFPFVLMKAITFCANGMVFTKTDGFISEQNKKCSWKIQECLY